MSKDWREINTDISTDFQECIVISLFFTERNHKENPIICFFQRLEEIMMLWEEKIS